MLERMAAIPGLKRFLNFVRVQTTFRAEFKRFETQSRKSGDRFALRWKDRWPILNDRTGNTPFDPHGLYYIGWATRKVAQIKPVEHVDIGSSTLFAVALSAFVPVKYYEFRPARIVFDNLESGRADLLGLPFADGSLSSLSCMHVLEHVGLGRYGDTMDPDGDLKAFAELKRVLAPGGSLLIVVPVGAPRIQFNAHRIFSYDQITKSFAPLALREFALLPDEWANGLVVNATSAQANGQAYGCGCFWFTKRSEA